MMTIISDKKDEKIISSKYQNYKDAFDKTDVNKLSKHRFHDHAIETKNKIFSFESIYDLFITELEILRKYLDDNLKRKFLVFFSSLTETLIMFVKKKTTICDYA